MANNALQDLYVLGRPYTFEIPGQPAPPDQPDAVAQPAVRVQVWVQKLNDVDQSTAFKKARAAQARALVSLRDEDSDEYLEQLAKVSSMTVGDMADMILRERRARVMMAEESKLSLEDEWAADDYLEGLRDAVRGLSAAVGDTEHEDHAEAVRVYDELARFNAAVQASADEILAGEREALVAKGAQNLEPEVMPLVIKEAAGAAFVEEFQRCQVWLGTRKCTHQHKEGERPKFHPDRFFESRSDVSTISDVVYMSLTLMMDLLTVDVLQGKGLEGTPDSSSLSDSPGEQAAGVSSGLEDAVL